MQTRPTLHFALMCNQSNGGFVSALTLIDALRDRYEICAWSLIGELYPGHGELFEARKIPLEIASPVVNVKPGEHLFFYMNEYPGVFGNYTAAWQAQLSRAASVQIAFNRTVGAMPRETWLAEHLHGIYFQDSRMQGEWRQMVRDNPLASVATFVLPPPVNIAPFLGLQKSQAGPLVFGRLAGDGAVGAQSIELYARLAKAHPGAQFWFMPAPEVLREAFSENPQFRFFRPNQIAVSDFLQASDIFLLTYREGVPVPGPRSLVEAMAAGCAPVVINREGPQARIEHAVSGFCADNDAEFFTYAQRLAMDAELRSRIGAAARERARTFRVADWVDRIDRCAANIDPG